MKLWDKGGKIFVCGSPEEMVEKAGGEAMDEKIVSWFESMRNESYATECLIKEGLGFGVYFFKLTQS